MILLLHNMYYLNYSHLLCGFEMFLGNMQEILNNRFFQKKILLFFSEFSFSSFFSKFSSFSVLLFSSFFSKFSSFFFHLFVYYHFHLFLLYLFLYYHYFYLLKNSIFINIKGFFLNINNYYFSFSIRNFSFLEYNNIISFFNI